MENIHRVVTALGCRVVVSFTTLGLVSLRPCDCPLRILPSYWRLVVVTQFLYMSWRIAATLPSHHKIDLRNPEVFLNFPVRERI
jgi:hypothetical protein